MAAPDGSIDYVNQKGIEYTGRTLEDLQQKGWIDLIHPDDFEETSSHWNRLLTESVGYDTVNRLCVPTGNTVGFTSALPLSGMTIERPSRFTESISNGIEAMESNARPPHLMIRANLVNKGEVLIEVIDSGPGLKDTENI
jgi:PAS domain-containing protein